MPDRMEVLSSRATGVRAASVAFLGVAVAVGVLLCAVALLAEDRLRAGVPVGLVFYPVLWVLAIGLYRRVWRAAHRVAIEGDRLVADLRGVRLSVPLTSVALVETTLSAPALVHVVLTSPDASATEVTFFALGGAASGARALRSRLTG